MHWDLMLESHGVLRTWRLLEEPAAGKQVPAEPLPDHRLAYLDYEGRSRNNRGTVTRWDAGHYELETDISDRIEIRLLGTQGLSRGGFREQLKSAMLVL